MREKFLVTSREDMERRGWDQLDFVYINGDAYVDHPGFAAALIGRVLESRGYRVGIISQPDWHSAEPFKQLGRPRLAALITAGNLDSMLNEKTAAKKFRSHDSYSPGGEAGRRPERATIVYANRMREAYKDVPIIIGGIEASLRRFAHYDYWSNKVRHSILLDSKADILSYGMGEHSVVEIADALAEGKTVAEMYDIRGICYVTSRPPISDKTVVCPSYEEVKADKLAFARAFKMQYEEQDPFYGKTLIQPSENRFVVQTPPALPLTTEEMDAIYELPFQRRWHPDYDAAGGVPALHEVQFSLTSQRGCFGHCHFCAIASHQGRIIQHRSHESLVRETERMTHLPGFKGYIHDVGGPTANFRHVACAKQLKDGACRNRHCIGSETCPNLDTSHDDYVKLLREIRSVKGVKKVFVRSGLRYDYVLADHNKAFVKELCQYHVSGQLKGTMLADAREHHAAWDRAADVVIADVPCSGLGIIFKKSYIRYKNLEELAQLPIIQREILENVCRYVRSGGVLVYSTCTILPEENEQVTEAFLQAHPEFERTAFTLPLPIGTCDGQLTLWPQRHGTDGFYICRMRRKD